MNSIYCFINKINGKKYIGSTTIDPQKRYNQHIYNSKHEESSKYNYPLYCAFRKYGINNFEYKILEQKECSEEEIRKIEYDYIKKYDCISPNGYNQTENTMHPLNDPLTYKKVSETKRENAKQVAEIDKNNNILKIWRSIVDCAEETSLDERKIASVCRGERKTTQQKRFCWLDENNNLLLPEYKRDPYKGEQGTTQIQSSSRQVAKIDPKTQEIIKIYPTIALAARENECDPSGISKTCRGKRKICGGFLWNYIDN